jgi:hypothetical protein
MSSPSDSRHVVLPVQQVRAKPREACKLLDHAFWPDDTSLRDDDLFDFNRVQGPHQINHL